MNKHNVGDQVNLFGEHKEVVGTITKVTNPKELCINEHDIQPDDVWYVVDWNDDITSNEPEHNLIPFQPIDLLIFE